MDPYLSNLRRLDFEREKNSPLAVLFAVVFAVPFVWLDRRIHKIDTALPPGLVSGFLYFNNTDDCRPTWLR